MLSKAELKFLIEGKTSNPGYDAVMRFRVRQKLLKFQRDDLPALKRGDWGTQLLDTILRITENRNITESRNVGENENSPYSAPFRENVVRGTGFEPANPYGTSPSSWHLWSAVWTFDQTRPPPRQNKIMCCKGFKLFRVS
ncbi:hypothetical protein ES706_03504 [subsurface metagenome]